MQNKKFLRISELGRGWATLNATAAMSLVSRSARRRLEPAIQMLGVYKRSPKLTPASSTVFVSPDTEVRLKHGSSAAWQVSVEELMFVAGLAIIRRPSTIFEIGTFDGRTTYNLWLNCPSASIVTLDLPPGTIPLPEGKSAGMLIKDLVQDGAVVQEYADSMTYDYAPYLGKQEFVFIDAGHSYENAAADTASALRLVEGNEGSILWHDYATWPGVTQAVEETAERVASKVTFHWIEGTTLALMETEPGEPLRLRD